MYIRNAWYMAGWSRDVPAAAPTAHGFLARMIRSFSNSRGSRLVLIVAAFSPCKHSP